MKVNFAFHSFGVDKIDTKYVPLKRKFTLPGIASIMPKTETTVSPSLSSPHEVIAPEMETILIDDKNKEIIIPHKNSE